MKVLLVMHECNAPYNTFPYGLGYVAAALLRAGCAVTVFDQAVTHASNDALCRFIRQNGPYDLIGTGFQAAYYHTALSLCQAVNAARGKTPLLIGGSAASASPEHIMDAFGATYVITGETEHVIARLLPVLAGEADPSTVPGLVWRRDGVLINNPRVPVPRDLDTVPLPAWDLFDMRSYTFPRRYPGVNGLVRGMGMLSSRGCPYTCKFCYRLEEGYRMRSIDSCLEELRVLQERYGVDFIEFHDDLFVLSIERVSEFCERLSSSGMRFHWTCNGRFNIASRTMFALMKRAGCVEVLYGLESGDQRVLDEMDKRITVDQIREVAAMTKEAGLLVAVPSMFGLPHETAESLERTVDLIIETTSWHDKRTIRPMQPYPGSPYFKECCARGLLRDAADFYRRYFSSEKWTVNMTDLPDDEFDRLLLLANERLLKAHYDRALARDVEMFRRIYRDRTTDGFVPMR